MTEAGDLIRRQVEEAMARGGPLPPPPDPDAPEPPLVAPTPPNVAQTVRVDGPTLLPPGTARMVLTVQTREGMVAREVQPPPRARAVQTVYRFDAAEVLVWAGLVMLGDGGAVLDVVPVYPDGARG